MQIMCLKKCFIISLYLSDSQCLLEKRIGRKYIIPQGEDFQIRNNISHNLVNMFKKEVIIKLLEMAIS